MTFTLVWAAAIATVALALDRAYNISDILIFASGFFGGELCLLTRLNGTLSRKRRRLRHQAKILHTPQN